MGNLEGNLREIQVQVCSSMFHQKVNLEVEIPTGEIDILLIKYIAQNTSYKGLEEILRLSHSPGNATISGGLAC